MMPLPVSEISTQVDRILTTAAYSELESQPAIEEVDHIACDVGSTDHPLVHQGQRIATHLSGLYPRVDREVRVRSEVQRWAVCNRDAIVPGDAHRLINFPR